VHQFPCVGNLSPEQDVANAIRRAVDAKGGKSSGFASREATALAVTNEAIRICLRADLQTLADSYGEEVEVGGLRYRRHESGDVTYHSLCGGLDTVRSTYRQVGVHNGPTIVPLELEAGLIERATPALAHRIALGYGKDHMRSCQEDMIADHRRPPSRSTLERIAKAVGKDAKAVAENIEEVVRCDERLPVEAVAVSVGLDRTSVPMEEDVESGEKPDGRRKKRTKPYKREIPRRVNVNYRMAYVGTISFHDADAEVISTIRYAAGAHESPDGIVGRLMADMRNALRQRSDLAVGLVQDGAPELWNLLRTAIAQEPMVVRWHEAIDRYHLNERLAKVLKLTEPDDTKRRGQLSRWNDSLDCNDNAIYRIRQHIRDLHIAAQQEGQTELAENLEPHVTYLENNAKLMRYATLRATGLPVGSGATEGACKSVIEMRTNGCGQRWRPDGLDAVLTLRASHLSGRLHRFWEVFSSRRQAEVKRCA
jgi:hypothetical protein